VAAFELGVEPLRGSLLARIAPRINREAAAAPSDAIDRAASPRPAR
jgi:hypothetical protein